MLIYPHMYLNECHLRDMYVFNLSSTCTSTATHADLPDVSSKTSTRRQNSCAKFILPVTLNLVAYGLWERTTKFDLRVDRGSIVSTEYTHSSREEWGYRINIPPLNKSQYMVA